MLALGLIVSRYYQEKQGQGIRARPWKGFYSKLNELSQELGKRYLHVGEGWEYTNK